MPECAYKSCYIQGKGTDLVRIEDMEFKSEVLRKNLDKVEKVFPRVALVAVHRMTRLGWTS